MQKIFLLALLLSATLFLSAQAPASSSVFFELDKSELSVETRQTLDDLAARLLEAPDYSVNIEAYTDDLGTEEYNLRLAADRADAVQQYLAGKGILPGKTSVKSWGERKLAHDNATEESRRKNRRVDLSVTALHFSDFVTFQNRLSANTEQVLTIQPDQAQTVVAANGTTIVVPPQSFVFDDGSSPTGPVQLLVREAFSPSDFVLQNLTTTSDGRILQTGGMVYIGAQSDGKPLSLTNGATLTVAIPTGKPDPGMELFYGERNTDNSVNWEPVGQKFRSSLQNPQLTLDIDPELGKQIMALRVPVYPRPDVPNFANELPPEPRYPNKPYAPNPPLKPTWEDVQYMFGSRGGEAMSRKDSKKAKKYYREALERYERDSAAYENLRARYEEKTANYEKAVARFNTQHENWRLELKNRIRIIMDYEREEYLHQYSLALQKALKRAGKNIQRYENYSNLEYAVHSAAASFYGLSVKEGLTKRHGSRDMFYKHIGYKIVENYREFNNLVYSVKYAYRGDTLHRATAKMLKSCGVKAISDSLKLELKEKRLLAAKTSQQADIALRAYVADVTKLGWINCDKFYSDPAEKVQIAVNEQEDATIYVICKDINSILPMSHNGQGVYAANGLPKGKKVSVVSIKLKDGAPQFAMRELKAGEAGALSMDYRNISLKDLREELKRLNI